MNFGHRKSHARGPLKGLTTEYARVAESADAHV